MADAPPPRYINRELSWLSFNGRVLQEAEDPRVPLLERLKFLAIYSSNLDEFFRVRVAMLRALLRLKKKKIDQLDFAPVRLLKQIHRMVSAQQERFGAIFRQQILPGLEDHGIHLVDERQLDARQQRFLQAYFNETIRPRLHPTLLVDSAEEVPFLKNRALYLVTELWPRDDRESRFVIEPHYGLVEVPSPPLPRFVELPSPEGEHHVLFLDDAIRAHLADLFPTYEVGPAYAVKLSRDAELYLEDEFSGNLVEMIKKSLRKRETGIPTRFLYDLRTPYGVVRFLKQCFQLEDEDMIQGGRYHNFNDFFSFPGFGKDELGFEPMPPLAHPVLAQATSFFDTLAEQDRLLHFPYQRYDYVIDFLHEAATDPQVEEVWVTLYRVASDSAVNQELIRAAEAGKQVTAFVELKARFDEATNVVWAERMEAAGVRVLYSMPKLKVHAKIALVARREESDLRHYAFLSTGNFNEKTARVYTDFGLFTADARLADEVRRVFGFLLERTPDEVQPFEHLLVAPFDMRERFYALIEREMAHAAAGRTARMTLKMNSLEDPEIIAKLYEASQAGVEIRLLVRGICCLVPGIADLSENITITSIVDRFLEHPRVYLFHNDGDAVCYLASADWMTRNLSRRVEVAFPLYDPHIFQQIQLYLGLQLTDNTKARYLDAHQQNQYVPRPPDAPEIRAQYDTYRLLESQRQTMPLET